MTQNALTVLQFLAAWGWRFFTGYYIPGTNVTPGAILFFVLFVHVVINFIRRVTDVSKMPDKKDKEG